MTLIEIMISAGIFGFAALAMTTLFSSHAERVNLLRNEGALSESATDFIESLEGILSSATQIFFCGCSMNCTFGNSAGGSGRAMTTSRDENCHNPEGATDLCDPGNTVKRLLVFETEDAPEPGEPLRAGMNICTGNGSVGTLGQLIPADTATFGQGMVLRGCKRIVRLAFEAPRGNPPTVAVTPGRLTLRYLPASAPLSTASVPASSVLLGSVEGVYRVWCGMNQPSPTAGPNSSPNFGRGDSFNLSFQAKSRRRNDNSPANFEPWGPVDGTGVSAPALPGARARFLMGTHRTYLSQTQLPNIGTRGLIVGKAQSERGCSRGSGVGIRCCSGYFNLAGSVRTCRDDCLTSGSASTNLEQCCSHMRQGSTCL
jgi:hypothetical protein